jgi:hypothetical protein
MASSPVPFEHTGHSDLTLGIQLWCVRSQPLTGSGKQFQICPAIPGHFFCYYGVPEVAHLDNFKQEETQISFKKQF